VWVGASFRVMQSTIPHAYDGEFVSLRAGQIADRLACYSPRSAGSRDCTLTSVCKFAQARRMGSGAPRLLTPLSTGNNKRSGQNDCSSSAIHKLSTPVTSTDHSYFLRARFLSHDSFRSRTRIKRKFEILTRLRRGISTDPDRSSRNNSGTVTSADLRHSRRNP
jgi:hypothetical protein